MESLRNAAPGEDDGLVESRWLRPACVAASALAAVAIVGRVIGVELLASGIPSSIPMAPSTAAAFLLLSAALHPGLPWSGSRRVEGALTGLVFLLAAPSLAASANGGTGLELWRMSPLTGALFLALNASVLSILARGRRAPAPAAVAGTVVVQALSFVVMIGYLYGTPFFYNGRVIPIAATTAACFLLLSSAVIFEFGRRVWPFSYLLENKTAGLLTRSLVPALAAIMIVDVFIDLRLASFGMALSHSVETLLVLAVMSWAVLLISRKVSAAIEKAERGMREREILSRSLIEHLPQRIAIKDRELSYLFCNTNFARDLGIGPGQVVGKDDFRLFPRALAEAYRADDLKVIADGKARDLIERRDAAGEERWVHTVKIPYRDDRGEIIGVLGLFEDITEQRSREAEARLNARRVRLLLDSTAEGIYAVDTEGKCTLVNKSCLDLLGYERAEELLGRFMHDVMHHRGADGAPLPAKECRIYLAFQEARPIHVADDVFWRKDGTGIPVEFWSYPMFEAGKIIGAVATFVDIIERKKAAESLARSEAQLRQAQKMESVGRLAGGVAHDFNNILTAVSGYTAFVLAELPEGDAKREDLKEVLDASDRACRLTKQLLAFSRKQILQPEVLDMNSVVGGIAKMLKRLIGEDIKLETRLAAHSCLARVDAGQMEQVFLNLAVNARDAMPNGGTLTLETATLSLDGAGAPGSPDRPRGNAVGLTVRDTGCGMNEAVRARLFEPFFTTKDVGKGTGLGLATVYGIVKQSGGDIEVESAPGKGAVFRIYLPQVEDEARERPGVPEADDSERFQGRETVLLVEDDESVRRIGERVLAAKGYTLLVAQDGPEALKRLERHGRPVDLLIADVVMPGMSGRELARAVMKMKMARRTLFVSGYIDDAIVRHGVLEPGLAFLYKPFSPDGLLRKTREVLDGPADQARA